MSRWRAKVCDLESEDPVITLPRLSLTSDSRRSVSSIADSLELANCMFKMCFLSAIAISGAHLIIYCEPTRLCLTLNVAALALIHNC